MAERNFPEVKTYRAICKYSDRACTIAMSDSKNEFAVFFEDGKVIAYGSFCEITPQSQGFVMVDEYEAEDAQ